MVLETKVNFQQRTIGSSHGKLNGQEVRVLKFKMKILQVLPSKSNITIKIYFIQPS